MSELEDLTHTDAQNRLNNEWFVSMFPTANVLEFASQTLIIYGAWDFNNWTSVYFPFWGEDVSLKFGGFHKVCVLKQRRHIWEQEQADSLRRGGVERRLQSARLIAHAHIPSLHAPCVVHHRHAGALKSSPLSAVSTSLFAWRYSVSGLSSVSHKCG